MGNHLKFPLAVIDEVLKLKETYANKDFIVGYSYHQKKQNHLVFQWNTQKN